MNTDIEKFDARSRRNLVGVHPDLVRVVERASEITAAPFVVIEGVRTAARQAELVKAGASQTLQGRHLHGFAVDLAATVGAEIRWDWPLYFKIADAMLRAADEEGVPLNVRVVASKLNHTGRSAPSANVALKVNVVPTSTSANASAGTSKRNAVSCVALWSKSGFATVGAF